MKEKLISATKSIAKWTAILAFSWYLLEKFLQKSESEQSLFWMFAAVIFGLWVISKQIEKLSTRIDYRISVLEKQVSKTVNNNEF